VSFVQGNEVFATADAQWIKHRCCEDYDAVVYRNNRDGTRTLLEFHFRGMNKVLAFGRPIAVSADLRPLAGADPTNSHAAVQREGDLHETHSFDSKGPRATPGFIVHSEVSHVEASVVRGTAAR